MFQNLVKPLGASVARGGILSNIYFLVQNHRNTREIKNIILSTTKIIFVAIHFFSNLITNAL